MELLKLLISFCKLFVPPRQEDIAGQVRWRWVMFIGFCAVSIHVAWACGLLTVISPQLAGFATVADSSSMSGRIDVIAIIDIRREIRVKAAERCNAKDSGTRNELTDDIDRLQDAYQRISKTTYRIPVCSDL
jgi:hypothetical protein